MVLCVLGPRAMFEIGSLSVLAPQYVVPGNVLLCSSYQGGEQPVYLFFS